MSEARKITNHAEIRKWAEARGGVPTIVKGTEKGGEGAGILRFEFDGPKDRLEPVDWDTFFETFEEKHLALLAQDKIDGKLSRFFKFVER
ncbi:MAG TPA: hypothetical protein VFA12_14635 [Stellaceae bacterium]|nr:hypothetical protein [Stellaceae bacterium]